MKHVRKKFNAGVIGLAVATLTIWGFNVLVPGVPVPDPVAGAWGVLCVTGVSMLIPDPLEE